MIFASGDPVRSRRAWLAVTPVMLRESTALSIRWSARQPARLAGQLLEIFFNRGP